MISELAVGIDLKRALKGLGRRIQITEFDETVSKASKGEWFLRSGGRVALDQAKSSFVG